MISSNIEYSKEIIDRYKAYMKEDYDREVSDDEAQIEIHRLTSLFTILSDIDRRRQPGEDAEK